MSLHTILAAALLIGVASTDASFAGPGEAGHSHATFSAGEPGNPKRPARSIEITMTEKDEKMVFLPDRIDVKRGEQIRFRLRNSGELEHEFVLATTEENLRHAEEMKKSPEMGHDNPNARRLDPRRTGDMVWRFTRAGQFEYGCLILGHREAGMTGIITVK
jgi:uncharacterized cupredoxin-like copper-binding protein